MERITEYSQEWINFSLYPELKKIMIFKPKFKKMNEYVLEIIYNELFGCEFKVKFEKTSHRSVALVMYCAATTTID